MLTTAVSSGQGLVDSVDRIASEATQPLSYILSFDSGTDLHLSLID